MLSIDHVIYAVQDLDAFARRLFDEHGLASYEGGVHPAWGTENRIIPLGSSYLELVTVVDVDVARVNPFGRAVLQVLHERDGFLGWVVRVNGLVRVTERQSLEAVPGSRTLPDGSVVSWRTAGMDTMISDPSMPFFIEWDDMARHPATVSIEHHSEPKGIEWIELAPSSGAALQAWLLNEQLALRLVHGAPGVKAVGISTADVEIELR